MSDAKRRPNVEVRTELSVVRFSFLAPLPLNVWRAPCIQKTRINPIVYSITLGCHLWSDATSDTHSLGELDTLMTTLGVTLFGPVSVRRGEREIPLGPPKQRSVFAVLAARAGEVVRREELVRAVWGVDASPTAMNSVYTYVARLRNQLEPFRRQRARPDLLVSDSLGYMLRLAPDEVDTKRFTAYLRRARKLQAERLPRAAIEEIESALALWQGPPFGGVVGPFFEAEHAALSEMRLTAIEDRVHLLYQLGGDLSGELAELSALVRRHPLRERLRYVLMLCHLQAGTQTEAIREYNDFRTRLADEQGLEPGERLQQLYAEALKSAPRREGGRLVKPTGWRTETPRPPVPLAQLTRDVPDFTGRKAEIRRLHELVDTATDRGESAVVLINGVPGVGKSALAVHFAHELSARFPDGQVQLDLRGYGAGQPMHPREALHRLLEALGVTTAPDMDPERQRALLHSLVAGRRLLILLDNARWVQQVRPLLPGDSSCLVLVTSRNGLGGLIARDGARRLRLDGMRVDDGVELFGRIAGRALVASAYPAVRELVEACGGLPLALRIAAAQTELSPSPERTLALFNGVDLLHRLSVPGDEQSSLITVFEWSYAALPERARRMFRALGRGSGAGVTLRTAAALTGESIEEAREHLDILVDAGLAYEPVQDSLLLTPLLFAYARYLYFRESTDESCRAGSS